jgi:type I restriction enzyme ecoKI subunit R
MKEDVLPEGWEKINIQKAFSQVSTTGKKIPTKDILPFGKYPVIDQGEEFISGYFNNKDKVISANSGIVIFGDHTRNFKLVNFDFIPGGDGTKILKPNVGIDLEFFYFQCLYLELPDKGYHRHFKYFKESNFYLPPLPEQQYLSQKLTALLDEVAQTKQRLEAIPAQLKQFRQSVLADAVSGRLTEIAPKMTKMSDIAKFQNGFAFNSEDFSKSGEWQVFRLGNIRDGFLFYENKPVFISEKLAKTQEKFIPKVGDSLISMTGTRFKQDYGFACIVEKDEKILVNQRVGRIIPIKDKIIPKFLNLSLRSEHFRQQFFKGETGGVNQGNVGSKHIMSISINLPTLEQQTQIVQKVETYFALADEIETQVKAALENVNLLTQSILAKAFSGELSAAWRNSQVTETQGNV